MMCDSDAIELEEIREVDEDNDNLAVLIRRQHRGRLRELRIEIAAGVVILHGRAASFYGKQIALHEVQLRFKDTPVVNRIVVDGSIDATPRSR